MLCLCGFELFSRWVPLSIWENKCDVTNTAAVVTYCKDVMTSDNLQGIPMYTKNHVVQRLAICSSLRSKRFRSSYSYLLSSQLSRRTRPETLDMQAKSAGAFLSKHDTSPLAVMA